MNVVLYFDVVALVYIISSHGCTTFIGIEYTRPLHLEIIYHTIVMVGLPKDDPS